MRTARTWEWFRGKIRDAYGGRAPRVLDPFAGGGAIPLEAMRLGCEVTAVDINPVAWFILKCTLEYPQKLAGQTRPLPEFVLADREFMEAFLKAKGYKGAGLRTALERLGHGNGGGTQLQAMPHDDPVAKADLAWHVRAWGRWVLARARRELASFYPTYADFESLEPGTQYDPCPMRMLELDENGVAQIDPLNAEFDTAYLHDPRNPRWIAKPTVAYLWARTVSCKQCRATLPLLKTRLAVQEGQQARPPDDGAKGRPHGRSLRGAARCAPERRQRGAAAGTRQTHWGRNHVPDRRNLPKLRRYYDHGRHSF